MGSVVFGFVFYVCGAAEYDVPGNVVELPE